MQPFDEGVCGWIAYGGRPGLDVMSPKDGLKQAAEELFALVKDADFWARIARKPFVFKTLADMGGGFVVDANDFAEVGDLVDDREGVKRVCLIANFEGPGSDKIDGDLSPGHFIRVAGRQFTILAARELAFLACDASTDDVLAAT